MPFGKDAGFVIGVYATLWANNRHGKIKIGQILGNLPDAICLMDFELAVAVHDEDLVSGYSFAMAAVEFYLCARCAAE